MATQCFLRLPGGTNHYDLPFVFYSLQLTSALLQPQLGLHSLDPIEKLSCLHLLCRWLWRWKCFLNPKHESSHHNLKFKSSFRKNILRAVIRTFAGKVSFQFDRSISFQSIPVTNCNELSFVCNDLIDWSIMASWSILSFELKPYLSIFPNQKISPMTSWDYLKFKVFLLIKSKLILL